MNVTENLTQNPTCETAIRAFKTRFREEMLVESSFASHTTTPHVITSKKEKVKSWEAKTSGLPLVTIVKQNSRLLFVKHTFILFIQ